MADSVRICWPLALFTLQYCVRENKEKKLGVVYSELFFFLIFKIEKVKVLVTQSCPTLCNPMDCSTPGSSVHGILQARILEGVAILFSRSSQPRDWTWVSCITGIFFTTKEAPFKLKYSWFTMLCQSLLYSRVTVHIYAFFSWYSFPWWFITGYWISSVCYIHFKLPT